MTAALAEWCTAAAAMCSMAMVVYCDASLTPNVRPAIVPRNIHMRTSSFTERSFSRPSAATRIGSALVISSLNPTASAPNRLLGLNIRLMLIVMRLIQIITQMTMPSPISSSRLPCGSGGRISSQNATPHSGAIYRLYAQPGVVRFPDDANSARKTSGSRAYAMTSRRRPWRHPGSVSQLRTGTRIWTAEASSSLASAAAPSRSGTPTRGIAAVDDGPVWPGGGTGGGAPAPQSAGGAGAAGGDGAAGLTGCAGLGGRPPW